ncbi:hypothetical protein H7U28_12790, partial [Coprobacillus cateniformis]|nr:hypothetical protein [Coprobacillus cateniformis]
MSDIFYYCNLALGKHIFYFHQLLQQSFYQSKHCVQFGNEENILIVDEYKRIKDTPGGEVIIDNCARQVRSWQTHLL